MDPVRAALWSALMTLFHTFLFLLASAVLGALFIAFAFCISYLLHEHVYPFLGQKAYEASCRLFDIQPAAPPPTPPPPAPHIAPEPKFPPLRLKPKPWISLRPTHKKRFWPADRRKADRGYISD